MGLTTSKRPLLPETTSASSGWKTKWFSLLIRVISTSSRWPSAFSRELAVYTPQDHHALTSPFFHGTTPPVAEARSLQRLPNPDGMASSPVRARSAATWENHTTLGHAVQSSIGMFFVVCL